MRLSIALPVLFMASTAMAEYSGPLVKKYSDSGIFTPPGEFVSTTCEIYPERVVITHNVGGVESGEVRSVSSKNLPAAIEQASKGSLKVEMAPTDGPALVYTAYKVISENVTEEVVLQKYTGGDGKKSYNLSAHAAGLRTLADKLCR